MYLFMFIYGSIKLKHNIIILISKLLLLNNILYYTRTIFRVNQFMCVILWYFFCLCVSLRAPGRQGPAPRQLPSFPRRKFGPERGQGSLARSNKVQRTSSRWSSGTHRDGCTALWGLHRRSPSQRTRITKMLSINKRQTD